MQTLVKLLYFLDIKERWQGAGLLVAMLIMAILDVVGIASVMPFLAVLSEPRLLKENQFLQIFSDYAAMIGLKSDDSIFLLLGGISILLILLSSSFRVLTFYFTNRFVEMRRHAISTRLFESYLRQPYIFFTMRNSNDLAKSLLSEVDIVVGGVIRPVLDMFVYGLVFLAVVTFLILVDPIIALSVSGVIFLLYLIIFFSLKEKISSCGNKRSESNIKRFVTTGEAFKAIKDVKLLNIENVYLSRFGPASLSFSWSQAKNQMYSNSPKFIIEGVVFSGLLVFICISIYSKGVNSDALSQLIPILALYAISAYRLQPAIQSIYKGVSSLKYGASAVEKLHTDLSKSKDVCMHRSEFSSPCLGSLDLKDVNFTYPSSDKHALKNITLSIPVGQSLGIMGQTGSGKSTLVDVILGLLTPDSGVVCLNNDPEFNSTNSGWSKMFGYVPQSISIVDDSITANIALGVDEADISVNKVALCAKMAQLDDFINELPDKYETMVGENGVRMSGGQRQRLGLARALYHDPKVLVLDEATSALDHETEEAVMNAIEKLAGKKTLIIIAHRLQTLRHCNKVVRVDDGQITFSGSYEDINLNAH